jgi:hypothetical protein
MVFKMISEKEINDNDLNRIIFKLESEGTEATEENIRKVYAEKKQCENYCDKFKRC